LIVDLVSVRPQGLVERHRTGRGECETPGRRYRTPAPTGPCTRGARDPGRRDSHVSVQVKPFVATPRRHIRANRGHRNANLGKHRRSCNGAHPATLIQRRSRAAQNPQKWARPSTKCIQRNRCGVPTAWNVCTAPSFCSAPGFQTTSVGASFGDPCRPEDATSASMSRGCVGRPDDGGSEAAQVVRG